MTVQVGDVAPDFELPDQHRQPVRLSDFRGKRRVAVVFFPFAFSRICTGELCALRDDLAELDAVDAHVLAISVDSVFANRAYAAQEGLGFPVLSDFWPHGEVARAYGVLDESTGAALRGTFVIDTEGVVAWSTVQGISEARDAEELKRALAAV